MEKEIDIKKLLNVFRKRLMMLTLITILCTAAAGVYGKSSTKPLYNSSTQLLIRVSDADFNSMGIILKDRGVLDKVISDLGINKTPEVLKGQINLTTTEGSKVLAISAVDTDPVMAAKIANTTANIFIKQIGNVLGIYNVTILSEAKPDKNPVTSSSWFKTLAIGFGVGLVVSIGLIFLLDGINDSLESENEIEKLLGCTVLGSISKMNRRNTAAKKSKKGSVIRGGTIGT